MKKLLLILSIILSIGSVKSQSLYFPNGNELNLHTTTNYLYAETKIYFKTRNSLVEDYRFEKTIDSLDERWEYSACFNGDCKIELMQEGDFNPEFGDNDTTGFIAFHVYTRDLDGGMKLGYKVSNKQNPTIFSTLLFNIIYTKPPVGLADVYSKNKPVIKQINNNRFLVEPKQETAILIYDLTGKLVYKTTINQTETLNLEQLTGGIYIANLTSGNHQYAQKIVIK